MESSSEKLLAGAGILDGQHDNPHDNDRYPEVADEFRQATEHRVSPVGINDLRRVHNAKPVDGGLRDQQDSGANETENEPAITAPRIFRSEEHRQDPFLDHDDEKGEGDEERVAGDPQDSE